MTRYQRQRLDTVEIPVVTVAQCMEDLRLHNSRAVTRDLRARGDSRVTEVMEALVA